MNQSIAAKSFDSGINFVEEIVPETLLTLIIPEGRIQRVLPSEMQFFDDELHGGVGARGRWCLPTVPQFRMRESLLATTELPGLAP